MAASPKSPSPPSPAARRALPRLVASVTRARSRVSSTGRAPTPRPSPSCAVTCASRSTGPAGINALITLDVGGTPGSRSSSDLQRDPIKRVVTHVDFLRINRDEEIKVEVPIDLEGEADDVLRNDGLVDQRSTTSPSIAKPGDIPPSFTIDISELVIGDVIRVHDLALPAGVTTPLDPETPLVTAEATRASIEEEAEGEEGAEGEAAEGAAESAESAGSDEG